MPITSLDSCIGSHDPKAAALIFRSGKVVCTGAKKRRRCDDCVGIRLRRTP
ncbi:hypothetical protein [Halorubrum sp. AS12]|uniref:hypothetical protein n=1 Tax=Halorubrum sp. AS12 TaxID=3409687 RepID=UPI003DA79FCB